MSRLVERSQELAKQAHQQFQMWQVSRDLQRALHPGRADSRTAQRIWALGGLTAVVGTACAPIAGAYETPPHDSPLVKVNEAGTDAFFIPRASGTDESWSFAYELRRPSRPYTVFSDFGSGINKLVLNGPTPDVGFDARFNSAYRRQLQGDEARAALWWNGLPKDTEIMVLDERDIKRVSILAGDDGFAGLLLPDRMGDDSDFLLRVRIARKNWDAITTNFSVLSQQDAANNRMPTTVADLARAFGQPAKVYPRMDSFPSVKAPEEEKPLPRYSFEEVSARPELYGSLFLAKDTKGVGFNNGIAFRIPHRVEGSFLRSMDGVGRIEVVRQTGNVGFDLDMDINPLRIGNYTLENGQQIPGAEPAAYLNIRPGSKAYLLDARRQQVWADGKERSAVADEQGNLLMTLPTDLSEVRLRVLDSNPAVPWDRNMTIGLGAKKPDYNPDPKHVLVGKSGALPLAETTFHRQTVELPLIPVSPVYRPR